MNSTTEKTIVVASSSLMILGYVICLFRLAIGA